MKKFVKIVILSGVLLLIFAFSFSVSLAYTYVPMEKIPGFTTTSDFPTYLSNIYKFAVWTVGIAALLMLSIGGFMYLTSAGNNARMEKAKGVITDSIFGVVMVMTAYLLLYVINPDLVGGGLGAFEGAAAPAVEKPAVQQAVVACTNPLQAACYSCKYKGVQQCLDCDGGAAGSCIQVTGVSCKESPCYLISSLVTKLQLANSSVPFRITEPWPPTVMHMSSCHKDGTCADVNTMNGSSKPEDVKKLFLALKGAGLSVVYESYLCGPYTAVGVNCKYYSTMTHPSFHVY